MGKQEAIEIIQERIDIGKREYADQIPEYIEALEKAVEALEKIDEIEELQTPEAPVQCSEGYPHWECPNCGGELSGLDIFAGHCKWCGKTLKEEDKK